MKRNQSLRICVVIPSFSPYCQIIPTLNSLLRAFSILENQEFTLLLSDSSPNVETVSCVTSWARNNGVDLLVERSDERRIVKAALNAAFNRREVNNFDVFIVTNDDVIFDIHAISILLQAFADEDVRAAVGVATLDDIFYSTKENRSLRWASAWQLKYMKNLADLKPKNSVRAEGSLWAARSEFVNVFRYTEKSGSIADDMELASFLISTEITTINASLAKVYKIPVKGFKEFANQTRRSQIGEKDALKNPDESRYILVHAVLRTILSNPFESFFYIAYRFLMLISLDKKYGVPGRDWNRSNSSFR